MKTKRPVQTHARAIAALWPLAVAVGAVAARLDAQTQPQIVRKFGFLDTVLVGDRTEVVVLGGITLVRDGVEARAEQGVLVFDTDERMAALDAMMQRESGLPRRGYEAPRTLRQTSAEVLRERMRRFLSALERQPAAPPANEPQTAPDFDLELLRSIYLEGGVSFVRDGREVVRADRVMFSVVDDRAVFEGAMLRFFRLDPLTGIENVVVVRAPRIERQAGGRFVGRDLSITSCEAGEPHFELFSGEAEIIEREDEFEIRSRDNWFALAGARVLPLPDITHFTSDPSNYFVQGATAGHSEQTGGELQLDLGAPMHGVGGAVHEFLTGRPAHEFRGNWHLGLGWIESRGFPIDGALDYRAADLYRGRTEHFVLDDEGEDYRELRNYLDGAPIDASDRRLTRTENRLHFNRTTSLDLTAFSASDPAVYSEFYNREWVEDELPESTAHFRHQADNYSLQALGRWNLADFAYGDSRALTPRFVEARPNVSFDWLAQPIATLPDGSPLLLTSASSVVRYDSDFDDRFASPIDDGTTRFDQELELAVPFDLGPLTARVFAGTRFTHFSETLRGTADERLAFTAGASLGTRLSRVFRWSDLGGNQHAIRHVVSPTVGFEHRFQVDGQPSDYHQFDRIDALDEAAGIRLGVLQRFQKRTHTPLREPSESRRSPEVQEFLWLDLAQNFAPISTRDNDGDVLGLGEFELLLRPSSPWLPLDDLTLVVEGEHDWDEHELRTFNTYTGFRALGPSWFVGYRADQTARGVLTYGTEIDLRGRWTLGFASDYDLATSQTLVHRGMLVRHDHDWQIVFGVMQNEIIDDLSFTIDFVPEFGGLFKPRGSRGYVGDVFRGYRYADY